MVALAGNTRHGHCVNGVVSLTYRSWEGMQTRCLNKNSAHYQHYGARGITVCERWKQFANFLADMGERPSKEHSIDRIDSSGNYEPGNCRWATLAEQNANSRKTNCKRGHELLGDNLIVRVRDGKTQRSCRACALMRGKGLI